MGNRERTDALTGGDRAVEEPAVRVLGGRSITEYGRVAARAPAKALTAAFKALDDFEPAFVDRARTAWSDLLSELPRTHLMRNVTFEWLLWHPYPPMRTFDVQAWTNAATDVYLADPGPHVDGEPFDEAAWWRTILYHEAVHVRQFANAGGPPDTYTRMMAYEIEAYENTHEWLDSTEHPTRYRTGMDELIGRMENAHNLFEEEVEWVDGSTADIDDPTEREERREEIFRRFLLGERWSDVPAFLPPHDEIGELYGN